MVLTDDMLAAEPRWESARLRALPGRCRGDLLGPWGENLARRFGADGLDRVRRRLGAPLDRVDAVLTARDWVPAYAQLAITEAIVDEHLGGDLRALYPLLVEDTRSSLGRAQLLLARSLGPRRMLWLAPRSFRKVYEVGSAEVELDGRRARLTFRGNPVFGHPSWRLLQLFATRTLLELTHATGSVLGEDGGHDAFVATATW